MRRLRTSALWILGGACMAPLLAADLPPSVPPSDARFETGRITWESSKLEFESRPLAAPTRTTKDEMVFELTADVLFDFDRADLRPEATAVLEQLAGQVRTKFPKARLRVEGHADAKGDETYNRELSHRRAAAIRAWLIGAGGFAGDRVTAAGLGETRPVAPNTRPDGSDDPAGRQRNRRVEVVARGA